MPEVAERVVPDLHFGPVALRGDIDHRHVLFDLAALAVDDGPVGVGHLDDPIGEHLTDHCNVAEAHGPLGLEHQDSAGLGRRALGIAAGGLLPPRPGVAEDLDAGEHAREGGALPVVLGPRASAGEGQHGHDEHGTKSGSHRFEHQRGSPSTMRTWIKPVS